MPLGYHSPNAFNGDGPDTRGTAARRQQLADVQKDIEPAGEAEGVMRGALGTMAARAAQHQAQAALNRQLRVQKGQSLYKGTKYVGGEPPE